jgi:3-oxoacyl-[acyl-carrier-protein] synthase III
MVFPSSACLLQSKIGAVGAWGFDLGAACSGFTYALTTGMQMVATGAHDHALVVGADVMSSIIDYRDRTTCVLFGDGAGAAILEPAEEPGVIDSLLALDGSQAELLTVPGGGSAEPPTRETVDARRHFLRMLDGQSVFKQAVVAMAEASTQLLEKSGVPSSDLALVVGHQANARILTALGRRLGLEPERVVVDIAEVGNTSAASIPIALDRAWRAGRMAPGDLILTVAFGAGLSWGANLIRWTAPPPRQARAPGGDVEREAPALG